MAESVYKVVGSGRHQHRIPGRRPPTAVERAAKSLRDLRVAEVVEQDIVIEKGQGAHSHQGEALLQVRGRVSLSYSARVPVSRPSPPVGTLSPKSRCDQRSTELPARSGSRTWSWREIAEAGGAHQELRHHGGEDGVRRRELEGEMARLGMATAAARRASTASARRPARGIGPPIGLRERRRTRRKRRTERR